jgi:hypothetical protein
MSDLLEMIWVVDLSSQLGTPGLTDAEQRLFAKTASFEVSNQKV